MKIAPQRLAWLLAACAATANAANEPVPALGEPSLAEVRAATERFVDVKVALAEGYIRDPADMCEDAEMMGKPTALGGMGIHFFRPDLLGITSPSNPRVNGNGMYIDFHRPAILIYEPQADGGLALVAVENLVFAKAWNAAHASPPSYQGVDFDHMIDDPATTLDEAHNFEEHYDRHIWIYRDNPNGIFAQFNPNVSCKFHHSANADDHHAGMAH